MKPKTTDRGRCPFCNKSFAMFSDEYIEKHKAKCEKKLNPYRYSERSRGRPSKKNAARR